MLVRRFFVLLVLLSSGALAAETLRMNAAIPEDTQRVAAETYTTVVLLNTLPARDYRLETKVEAHDIPLPDLNAELQRIRDRHAPAAGGPAVAPQPECDALAAATDALRTATSERDVASLRDTVILRRRAAAGVGCAAEVEQADEVVSRTTREFDTQLNIEAGTFATVTAFRIEADGKPTQVARKVFDAGPLGTINSHMLLGGISNEDERWFSKQTGESEFTVTREVDRRDNNPLAALLLTFAPAQDTSGLSQFFAFKRGAISGSFAVGLGTETDQPVYLFGYALNVTPRIGIALGLAGLNQKRLKGIYKGDGSDKLSENLTPEQLMDDDFDTGYWVGITLRP